MLFGMGGRFVKGFVLFFVFPIGNFRQKVTQEPRRRRVFEKNRFVEKLLAINLPLGERSEELCSPGHLVLRLQVLPGHVAW